MAKAFFAALMILLVWSGLFLLARAPTVTAQEARILMFDTMTGVPPDLNGTQNNIRGITGGGQPWTVASVKGQLLSSGKLDIDIQGLVFAAGPNEGKNTLPSFRAVVSCLRSDGSVQNVTTVPFTATLGAAEAGGGDAKIEAALTLPQPCIAPLVFITSPSGAWLAVNGN